jgi:hypothetical protein
MSWDAIGAIGEISGSLVVAITVLLLIAQLRQNTNSIRMASRSQVTETINKQLALTIQNEQLSLLVQNGLKGYESLGPNEKSRFAAYTQHQIRIWELAYFQWREGEKCRGDLFVHTCLIYSQQLTFCSYSGCVGTGTTSVL